MLKLIIGNKVYSSWSLRGWLAVRQSGLPFNEVVVSMYDEDWPERRMQPDIRPSGGKVPILWDGDAVVWDSLAIMEYLADKVGRERFWPRDDTARAMARAMVAEMHSSYQSLRKELPMNIRGIVSGAGEAASAATMNAYAEARMTSEREQAARVDNLSFLSPLLALRRASMALAGTDLLHYHRFLREAETVRFSFVQSLNQLHAEELDYADDIKRSSDAVAEQRTRVDASHWRLLPQLDFKVAPATERVAAALPMSAMLGAWLLAMLGLCAFAGRRMRP